MYISGFMPTKSNMEEGMLYFEGYQNLLSKIGEYWSKQ